MEAFTSRNNYVWYVWSIAKQKSSPKLQDIYWGQSCRHAALRDWGWLLTCQHYRAKISVHSKSQFSNRHTTMITSGTRLKGLDLISQEPDNRQFWRQSVQAMCRFWATQVCWVNPFLQNTSFKTHVTTTTNNNNNNNNTGKILMQ